MGGVFAVGDILNAIFPPKLKQVKYDTNLAGQQDEATAQLAKNRTANQASLGLFDSGVADALAKLGATSGEDSGTYAGIAKTLAGSDPEALRNRLADSNFNLFSKYSKLLGDQSTLSDRLQSARLGYGESGPSTYGSTLVADRTTKNLAPVLSQLLGNLGADTSNILASRRADFSAADDAIKNRAGVATRSLPLLLAPIHARDSVASSDLGLIGSGIANAKANTAGFKEEKNKWAAAGQAIDNSLNSALNTALSLYGGGMIGGGGNGGGGIGSLMSMFGGGSGGGSGGGISSLLSMLGGGGGSGGGAAPYWSAQPNGGYQPLGTYTPTMTSSYQVPSWLSSFKMPAMNYSGYLTPGY